MPLRVGLEAGGPSASPPSRTGDGFPRRAPAAPRSSRGRRGRRELLEKAALLQLVYEAEVHELLGPRLGGARIVGLDEVERRLDGAQRQLEVGLHDAALDLVGLVVRARIVAAEEVGRDLERVGLVGQVAVYGLPVGAQEALQRVGALGQARAGRAERHGRIRDARARDVVQGRVAGVVRVLVGWRGERGGVHVARQQRGDLLWAVARREQRYVHVGVEAQPWQRRAGHQISVAALGADSYPAAAQVGRAMDVRARDDRPREIWLGRPDEQEVAAAQPRADGADAPDDAHVHLAAEQRGGILGAGADADDLDVEPLL